MFKLLVNIFVSIFIPKEQRSKVKYHILGTKNRLRVRKRAKSVGKGLHCSGVNEVRVNKNTTIGNNVVLNGLTTYGNGEIIISDNVMIGANTVILSDSHNYKGDGVPFDNTIINKTTIIEELAWIGVNCIILPGAHIKEGAIVQSGSVVHGTIEAGAIVGGNPAKPFKYRDMERFYKIKAEGKIYTP